MWNGYQEVLRACKEQGYGGIGFVFAPKDDLCGVDLDGCLDPQTGEIEGWAQKASEPRNTHNNCPQTYKLRFRALLIEGRSELELLGLKERGAVRIAPPVMSSSLVMSRSAVRGRSSHLLWSLEGATVDAQAGFGCFSRSSTVVHRDRISPSYLWANLVSGYP